MNYSRFQKYKGFSLIELIVAISIFTLVIGAVASFSLDTFNSTLNDRRKVTASLYLQEINNAIIINKSDLWQSIIDETNSGDKTIEFINKKYQIVNGESEHKGISVSFTVNEVMRDASGNLVTTGGTIDAYSRKIILLAEWQDYLGKPQSLTEDIYVNNWNVQKWEQSTRADFIKGSTTDTFVLDEVVDDGEVQLETILYPDWCNPTLSIDEYDIPGSATATTVFAEFGKAYLGTAGNTTGVSFSEVDIEGVLDPTISIVGEYDDYLVNNIFVDGDYAYLATTDNSREVVILDISVQPYTVVGWYDASGTSDANTVFVQGDVGYVGQGRDVETFSLSPIIGNASQPNLDSISMVWFLGTVSQIVVRDNYIFASLHNDWYELGIVDASNPSDLKKTSETSVNNQQVYDIYVSEDGNRAYFGTNASSSEREFFILDTTIKTGPRPIVGSYDTNGMTIRGISIINEEGKAVLVGTGGEEYQAVNITTETNPTRCGGMQVDTGINDIDSVDDEEDNSFSYLMTRDTSSEFKIIRGGPGGGGADGVGFMEQGEFLSEVLDSGSATPYYFSLAWNATVPVGTTLQLQVRSGNSPDLTGQPWYGTLGAGTYFTNPSRESIPPIVSGKRYFQYRLYFTTTDQELTPVFEDFTLHFEE